MQVGQILQVLALNKFESPDARFNDIYSLLDNDIVCNFMEDILFNLERDDDLPPVDISPPIIRDSSLLAEDELNNLVNQSLLAEAFFTSPISDYVPAKSAQRNDSK
jgi:hypothetical protein